MHEVRVGNDLNWGGRRHADYFSLSQKEPVEFRPGFLFRISNFFSDKTFSFSGKKPQKIKTSDRFHTFPPGNISVLFAVAGCYAVTDSPTSRLACRFWTRCKCTAPCRVTRAAESLQRQAEEKLIQFTSEVRKLRRYSIGCRRYSTTCLRSHC